MAEGSAADSRTFSEQQTRRYGQARYVEREDMICYEGIKTSEGVDNDYDNENPGQDLSLILTTQNPSRIDVQTLRKNKVRDDLCCVSPQPLF